MNAFTQGFFGPFMLLRDCYRAARRVCLDFVGPPKTHSQVDEIINECRAQGIPVVDVPASRPIEALRGIPGAPGGEPK